MTVMTAAPPAMPTCWKRPGAAAAAEVAIGIGRVFPEKAGLVLLLVVQRLMVRWDWNGAVVFWEDARKTRK